MGRVKMQMTPINDIKKRKITFERRKKGMIKKAVELTTLCDVNVSMIIYTDDQVKPEIFPQDSQKLDTLIDMYKKNSSSDCGKSRSCDLSGFFKDRNIKIEQELDKAKMKNLENKYPTWYDFLDDFSESDLKEFAFQLEDKIVFVTNRIESIKKASNIQKFNQYSCNGNVVIYDNNFVQNNMITQPPNHILVNPNFINQYSSEDDNGYYWFDHTGLTSNDIDSNNLMMQSSSPSLMEAMGYKTFGFDVVDTDLLNGDENSFIIQSSDHSSLSNDNNLCLESPHLESSIRNEGFHDVLLSFTNEGAEDISYWY